MFGGWIGAEDLRALAGNIVALAALVTALTIIWRAPYVSKPLRWLARTMLTEPLTRFYHNVLDSWALHPDSPVARIDHRLSNVEYQLKPNGGSSLRDRVDATAVRVGAVPDPALVPFDLETR